LLKYAVVYYCFGSFFFSGALVAPTGIYFWCTAFAPPTLDPLPCNPPSAKGATTLLIDFECCGFPAFYGLAPDFLLGFFIADFDFLLGFFSSKWSSTFPPSSSSSVRNILAVGGA